MEKRKLRLHSDTENMDPEKDNDETTGADVRWNWFGGRVLLKRMNGWVLVSVIGLLCIFGTFAYALWVILKIVEAKS